jgi:hypothetical protein
MSRGLKNLFLIHALVGLLFGAPLLIKPGGFLQLFNWAPIDSLVSRILGAALLGLAWSSYRGWRATDKAQVAILIEMEAVYCALGCVGIVRHLLVRTYPIIVWVVLAVLAIFAVAWIAFWVREREGS